MLGILYAALGAFTFALNNVAMRRGVVTGSVLQGMALTVPFGGLTFLVIAIAFGELGQIAMYPAAAVAWLAGQGIVHFVFGRYCNYKSNQLMGVNLSAPVVQLQVVVAMVWAVLTLHEIFTVLQLAGSVLMLGGSFVTQRNAGGRRKIPGANTKPAFRPQIVSGYLFALGAALGYGTSPLMAREAFLAAPGLGTAAGGCIAYASATLCFALILFKPGAFRDISSTSRENLPWFLSGAVTVAVSQAFVYASLAAAPLIVVTPILQLSLVFRLGLSQWINREHEVMNIAVIVGAFAAVLGSLLVALPSDMLAGWLELPPTLSDFLRYRLAGG
ncbi:MAG TPA: DMT family transporter [Stellaceae bacterium]|nr:DMT family transporter [Stellaceae bacterium]